MQIKTKIVSCHTADSKPVRQEVNGKVILPPLVFPARAFVHKPGNYYLNKFILTFLLDNVVFTVDKIGVGLNVVFNVGCRVDDRSESETVVVAVQGLGPVS